MSKVTPVTFKESIYTSGSIEKNKDHGVWRNKLYKGLHRHYRVVIPTKSGCPFEKTDYEFKEFVHEKTVVKDMVDVLSARHFCVKIDPGVFGGAGTISEITIGSWFGKEMVYFLDGIEEVEIPLWTLGCLFGAHRVEDVDEAIEYYKELAKDKKKQRKEETEEA